MDVVAAHVHRALAYVKLLNDQGIFPSSQLVDAFTTSDSPREAQFENEIKAAISLSWALKQVRTQKGEPVVRYLFAVGWIESPRAKEIVLTGVGRAVLRGLAEREAVEPTVVDVILDPGDPLVYTHLTRIIGVGMSNYGRKVRQSSRRRSLRRLRML